jgi:hypothetical protein
VLLKRNMSYIAHITFYLHLNLSKIKNYFECSVCWINPLITTTNLKFLKGKEPFVIHQIKERKIGQILVKQKLKSPYGFPKY